MRRTFIIGDIHGCIASFKHLLYKVLDFSNVDRLILLGDYIDRGSNSRAVINEIIHLRNRGYSIITLLGNHEQMLLSASKFPENFALWKRNGGEKTCQSFMVDDIAELPAYYLSFFESLQYYHELDDFIVVHGGLNFEIENPLDDTESMIWMRNTSVDFDKTKGKRLIVGHTPTTLDDIRDSLESDIIKLDGGCVYHKTRKGLGYLVALELENMQLHYVENMDE